MADNLKTFSVKADDMEKALRLIDARIKGEWLDPAGDLESDIAGVLRPILAEIDGIQAGEAA